MPVTRHIRSQNALAGYRGQHYTAGKLKSPALPTAYLRIEQKYTEGAVQVALRPVLGEGMNILLAGRAKHAVVGINQNALVLLHEVQL